MQRKALKIKDRNGRLDEQPREEDRGGDEAGAAEGEVERVKHLRRRWKHVLEQSDDYIKLCIEDQEGKEF